MKLNVSNELKSRLMHAAENGSVIAKDILLEVKKNVPVEEIIRGTYNCFSTKRKRTEAGTFTVNETCILSPTAHSSPSMGFSTVKSVVCV